jgi:peptide chain release factor
MMNIWIQITSGRGPIECRAVVTRVAAMILAEAKDNSAVVQLIEQIEGGIPNTHYSIVLSAKSNELSWLRPWIGTIQWTSNSPYRTDTRRKNWFVAVQIIEQPKSQELQFSDVRIDTFRASGPGGQHVNKTETAVRATHLPTGIVAIAQDGRSQYENRQLAMERLKRRVQVGNEKAQNDARAQLRYKHDNVERGNPVKVFSGPEYNLV